MTAQDQAQPGVADRSSEFVAVEGGQETSSAASLLVSAYVLMWFFVFAIVYLSNKRLESLSRRLQDLEKALRKADAQSSARP